MAGKEDQPQRQRRPTYRQLIKQVQIVGDLAYQKAFGQALSALPEIPFPELSPNPKVIEVLNGQVIGLIETVSQKPGPEFGKLVNVCIVTEGAGLNGLTNQKDNKEWSTMNHHTLLTTRGAVFLGQRMARAQYDTNPQRIINGMLVSHAGRRQWDEAGWYPEIVPDAKAKRSISNETLGLQLIQDKVPQDAFELVAALAHNLEGFNIDPTIYDSLDYKIAIYVDHRTSQKYEPLHTRMGDFLIGNFFERGTVTPKLRKNIYKTIFSIVEKQKKYRLGDKKAKPISLDKADKVAESLGANAGSERLPRRELMRLILQDADTEATLISAGIDPNELNGNLPMPDWEHNYRFLYVKAAETEIKARIKQIIDETDPSYDISKKIDEEFPHDTWWGQYATKDLFENQSD